MMSLLSFSQGSDELVISVKLQNKTTDYTKVLIIEGYGEVDTIQTMHVYDSKFNLPPLDVRKDYTIVFINNSQVNSLYVVSAGAGAVETYTLKLLVDMNFVDDTGTIGSVEYLESRDGYKTFYSYALKKRN